MSSLVVRGLGAVSPAGWSLDSLRDALAKAEPLPIQTLPGPASCAPRRARLVPAPAVRRGFMSHPRVRRANPIARYAVGAALEALGVDAEQVQAGSMRLGAIVCVMAGCVGYSRRFYEETLRDPATASPLVFPETVFNAPASHLLALLGSPGLSYTLVGDAGMFLVGLGLAADWLLSGRVEACLVVGAEESDWIVSDAAYRFDRESVLAEGAGAIYLKLGTHPSDAVRLTAVTDAHSYVQGRGPAAAALAMRAQLSLSGQGHLLCDGLQGVPRLDEPEQSAWSHWTGTRLSPKRILGEGMAAGSAWQCVAAADALRDGRFEGACVSVVGANQQAIGAEFHAKTSTRFADESMTR